MGNSYNIIREGTERGIGEAYMKGEEPVILVYTSTRYRNKCKIFLSAYTDYIWTCFDCDQRRVTSHNHFFGTKYERGVGTVWGLQRRRGTTRNKKEQSKASSPHWKLDFNHTNRSSCDECCSTWQERAEQQRPPRGRPLKCVSVSEPAEKRSYPLTPPL